MIKKLFDFKYHPRLIDIMVKGSYSGAFIVNIFTPILLFFVLNEYFFNNEAYIWLFINLIIYVIRIISLKKIARLIVDKDANTIPYIYLTIAIVSVTSILYAFALFF